MLGVEVGRLEREEAMKRISIATLFGVLLLVGCNEVAEKQTVALEVTIVTHVSPLCEGTGELCEQRALEGVEICEGGSSHCVLTDDKGRATLELPADEEVYWTHQKEGYEPALIPQVTTAGFIERWSGFLIWSDERAAEWYQYLGSEYPPRGEGTVGVRLVPAIEGATFELRRATGTPFYDVEPPASFPALSDLDLDATTSEGSGGFLNVGPGEWEIEISGAEDCIPLAGWPSDEPNRVRFPVRERYWTVVQVRCRILR
jgi:hypothetical protein